jgi:hypothetical protein
LILEEAKRAEQRAKGAKLSPIARKSEELGGMTTDSERISLQSASIILAELEILISAMFALLEQGQAGRCKALHSTV